MHFVFGDVVGCGCAASLDIVVVHLVPTGAMWSQAQLIQLHARIRATLESTTCLIGDFNFVDLEAGRMLATTDQQCFDNDVGAGPVVPRLRP